MSAFFQILQFVWWTKDYKLKIVEFSDTFLWIISISSYSTYNNFVIHNLNAF
jgi:hypothetical protein